MSDREETETKIWSLALFALLGAALLVWWHDRPPPHKPQWPIPQEEHWRRNLSQTGVHDVQIPLKIRSDYARQHGLAEPDR